MSLENDKLIPLTEAAKRIKKPDGRPIGYNYAHKLMTRKGIPHERRKVVSQVITVDLEDLRWALENKYVKGPPPVKEQ